MFNALAETVAEKPMFRDSLSSGADAESIPAREYASIAVRSGPQNQRQSRRRWHTRKCGRYGGARKPAHDDAL